MTASKFAPIGTSVRAQRLSLLHASYTNGYGVFLETAVETNSLSLFATLVPNRNVSLMRRLQCNWDVKMSPSEYSNITAFVVSNIIIIIYI